MDVDDDSAQVRFPPPFVYIGILLIGFVVGRFIGKPGIGLDPVTGGVVGVMIGLIGIAVILSAIGLFKRIGNNLEPWKPATGIVRDGVYRVTRNPMYLGMALIFAGVALFFDSLAALMLLPVVIIIIQTTVIAREEKYLEAKFGEDYLSYKNEVRRWI